MVNKKLQVKKILVDFSKIKNIPLRIDGNIDMEDFAQMEEYKSVVKKLTELEVNTDWLFKNGFVIAGMLLKF